MCQEESLLWCRCFAIVSIALFQAIQATAEPQTYAPSSLVVDHLKMVRIWTLIDAIDGSKIH